VFRWGTTPITSPCRWQIGGPSCYHTPPITKCLPLPFTPSSDVVGLLHHWCHCWFVVLLRPWWFALPPYIALCKWWNFSTIKNKKKKSWIFPFYLFIYSIFIWFIRVCVCVCVCVCVHKWVFWEQFLKESNISICIYLKKIWFFLWIICKCLYFRLHGRFWCFDLSYIYLDFFLYLKVVFFGKIWKWLNILKMKIW